MLPATNNSSVQGDEWHFYKAEAHEPGRLTAATPASAARAHLSLTASPLHMLLSALWNMFV